MADKIGLGDIAKDNITGFEGVVVARSEWLHNCPRYVLAPRETKDGKPIENRSFDEMSLMRTGRGAHEVWAPQRPSKTVALGDLVKDCTSGLEGVAVGITIWSNGCVRVVVQPKELKDGLPVEQSTIDEKDLLILASANPKPAPARTGGPRPEPRRE